MNGHEEIRVDLAAYVASRLEGSRRAGWKSTWSLPRLREVAETIKELGASCARVESRCSRHILGIGAQEYAIGAWGRPAGDRAAPRRLLHLLSGSRGLDRRRRARR